MAGLRGCRRGRACAVRPPSSGRAETSAQGRRGGFTHVPATTHDGQTALRLYDDVMKGKILHRRYACAASRRNGSMVVGLPRWHPWRNRNILTAGAMTPSAIIVSMIGVALPVLGGIWLTPKSAPWFLLRPSRSHLVSLRIAGQPGHRIVPSSIGLSRMQMTIISETSRSRSHSLLDRQKRFGLHLCRRNRNQ